MTIAVDLGRKATKTKQTNIVSAKFQIAPSKAVVGVDRPIKALSMHIQMPYKGIIV